MDGNTVFLLDKNARASLGAYLIGRRHFHAAQIILNENSSFSELDPNIQRELIVNRQVISLTPNEAAVVGNKAANETDQENEIKDWLKKVSTSEILFSFLFCYTTSYPTYASFS